MTSQIYHWISVPILAELSGRSENKIRKTYRSVITDECIPLSEIPRYLVDKYLSEFLLRDKLIDFSFLNAIKSTDYESPLYSVEVQELFREMKMLREGEAISNAYSADGTSTKRLKILAAEYGISYSTFARRRHLYLNNSSLNRVISHNGTTEDTQDRYRKCCLYCRDLIIYMHEMPGKISAAKIFRDIKKSKPFPCSKCPYNPVVRNGKHKKGEHIPDAVCKRNSEYMIKPECDDTVCRIIGRIPEQQASSDLTPWLRKLNIFR